jgi:predicted transcriptional regulator
MVSAASIISTISDSKALLLFKAIAASDNDCSKILITKLNLTRKQFYSRIEELMNADLVKRIRGRYILTSLGKIIFSMILKMETAIEYYWKLKAIDSILLSANTAVPEQESHKILDVLIDDHQIKDLFIANNNNNKLGLPLTIAAQKN